MEKLPGFSQEKENKEKQTVKRKVMASQARKGESQKQAFPSQGWATEKTKAMNTSVGVLTIKIQVIVCLTWGKLLK